ncbi:hypothetical protein [Methylotuvimicrobium sp.]|uniref:hypothetical protein n=1 Tax=Methylotuvimicrobium sp. TaxID=2822413 RepID=UPI003D64D277
MEIGKRSKLSLSQFLSLFSGDDLYLIFGKYGIDYYRDSQIEISQSLMQANGDMIGELMNEVVCTKGDLRSKVSPKYRFDERWEELEKCLILDGYRVSERKIINIEPTIEGYAPLEDDLDRELKESYLSESGNVIKHINLSAQSFLKTEPDFNACLSHSRVALETLIRSIALSKGMERMEGAKAWGRSLGYLSEVDFINKKDESAISSIYTLISDGAHVPLGFTEQEYVRFGRNLVISMCYYIVKLFRGNNMPNN